MAKPKRDGSEQKKTRRRRRVLGSAKKTSPDPSDDRQGIFTDGAIYGVASWLWRTTTKTLSWSTARVYGIGGDGSDPSSAGVVVAWGVSGAMLLLGIAAVAALFRVRVKHVGTKRAQPQPAEKEKHQDRKYSQSRDERRGSGEERVRRSPKSQFSASNEARSLPGRPEKRKTTKGAVVSAEKAGERRVSLYDVLTGEAPLPPRGERAVTVDTTGSGIVCGVGGVGGGGGGGIAPLGGARRASIFDRIADIVFNEEQKEDNPVDVVAVRGELDKEFRVSFREGAMGMTLGMDPGSRNAVVGKIVEHGQAYRAGVHTGDLVIGVGEHTVSSYGTVLAFMNIMGRPIELRFRKADSSDGKIGDGSSGGGRVSGSGGGPASKSDTGAIAGGEAGGTTGQGGFRATSSGLKPLSIRGSHGRARGESPRKIKAPLSPISPRSSSKVSGLGGLGQEVASSDSGFSVKMERGVVVTKYGKKGTAAQRVLFLDGATMSVAWRDLDARSPGHRRPPSFTNLMKGQREALALSHLIEVVAGDETDPNRPSAKGSTMLREHCDESLLERSFALQFRERSLEMTCDSPAEMRQLVAGFRDLQQKYGT